MGKIFNLSPDGDMSISEALKLAKPGDTIALSSGWFEHEGAIKLPAGVSFIGEHYTKTAIIIRNAGYCLFQILGNSDSCVKNFSISGDGK